MCCSSPPIAGLCAWVNPTQRSSKLRWVTWDWRQIGCVANQASRDYHSACKQFSAHRFLVHVSFYHHFLLRSIDVLNVVLLVYSDSISFKWMRVAIHVFTAKVAWIRLIALCNFFVCFVGMKFIMCFLLSLGDDDWWRHYQWRGRCAEMRHARCASAHRQIQVLFRFS